MVGLLRIGTAVPFLGQGADHKHNNNDCSDDQGSSYNGDLHYFFSHATVAPHFFSGQRKPLRLPSKMLVSTRSGSIQN